MSLPAVRWAIRKGLASQQDLQAVTADIDRLRAELATLQAMTARLPSRDELHQLSLIAGQLAGRIEVTGARSDERHEEFHKSMELLERKLDAAVVQIQAPLTLILQALVEKK